MRLPTKQKAERVKKAQVKKNQSKTNSIAEKKRWEVILYKNYKDSSEYTVAKADIQLNKLRAGMVECCELKKVEINGESVILNNSWEEFITALIIVAQDKYGDSLIKVLTYGDVITGNTMMVTKDRYEIVSSEISKYKATGKYKIIHLSDIGYTVRVLCSGVNIIETISKLICLLGYSDNSIVFTLNNTLSNSKEKEDVWFEELEEVTEAMELHRLILQSVGK